MSRGIAVARKTATMRIARSLVTSLLVATFGCAATPSTNPSGSSAGGKADNGSSSSTTGFEDIFSYTQETDQALFDKMNELRGRLFQDFDDACGDAWCESGSEFAPIDFQCAVDRSTGHVKDCVWLFGAGTIDVAASTGSLMPHRDTYVCKIPFSGTPQQLVDALMLPKLSNGYLPSTLDQIVPGGSDSLFDILQGCM